jgi:pimeloyl-ACP methyl ester carboxylesterase
MTTAHSQPTEPSQPREPSHRTIATNGVELHVTEAGEGPLVVLAHGFPELAYSWRHQIPALAAAGYHVVAPDQRGYGRSSRPDAIEAYDIHHLTADLLGVLDALGEQQAVFVGHDWGSFVVSHQAVMHPDRVTALVNMSVPHIARGAVSPITAFRNVFADNFFYILYFQEPGPADAELNGDPARTMRRLLAARMAEEGGMDPAAFANDGRGFIDRMREPDGLPDWLSQNELDHYIAEFTRTGFTGGLNWYRNFDRNWVTTPELDGAKVTIPSLFIGGTLDPVIVMSPPVNAHPALTDHRGDILIDGAGHWVQQEVPGAVNTALIKFLDDVHKRSS